MQAVAKSELDYYETEWLRELESCEVFLRYMRKFAGAKSSRTIPKEVVTEYMVRVGNMMIQWPRLLQLGHALLKSSEDESSVFAWHATNYETAWRCFTRGEREYSSADKFLVLQVLRSLSWPNYSLNWCEAKFLRAQPKVLQARLERIIGVRLPD